MEKKVIVDMQDHDNYEVVTLEEAREWVIDYFEFHDIDNSLEFQGRISLAGWEDLDELLTINEYLILDSIEEIKELI